MERRGGRRLAHDEPDRLRPVRSSHGHRGERVRGPFAGDHRLRGITPGHDRTGDGLLAGMAGSKLELQDPGRVCFLLRLGARHHRRVDLPDVPRDLAGGVLVHGLPRRVEARLDVSGPGALRGFRHRGFCEDRDGGGVGGRGEQHVLGCFRLPHRGIGGRHQSAPGLPPDRNPRRQVAVLAPAAVHGACPGQSVVSAREPPRRPRHRPRARGILRVP